MLVNYEKWSSIFLLTLKSVWLKEHLYENRCVSHVASKNSFFDSKNAINFAVFLFSLHKLRGPMQGFETPKFPPCFALKSTVTLLCSLFLELSIKIIKFVQNCFSKQQQQIRLFCLCPQFLQNIFARSLQHFHYVTQQCIFNGNAYKCLFWANSGAVNL